LLKNTVGLVTARGGSKGLPGKNVALLDGRPLIAWTIEAALACPTLSRVIVSTDCAEIAAVARQHGAEVPFLRPAAISLDDSPHILATEHVLEWLLLNEDLRPPYVMLLQPTSPLRTSEDISAVIGLARSTGAPGVVAVSEARPHPMKTFALDATGALVPFVKSDIFYRRRQDLPVAYADNGSIYLTRCAALVAERSHIPSGTIPYLMPPERSIDIDSAWDLKIAEMALRSLYSSGAGDVADEPSP
jgi:CMP-N,N'-diacetyllegionaminic acid synthase